MEDRIVTVNSFLDKVMKKKKTIIPQQSLVEDLCLNSIQFMELISLIEEKYDVMVPVQKLQYLKKVEDLYVVIEKLEDFCRV